jgi:hypothetical protein
VFADDKVKSLKVYLVVLRSVLPYWLWGGEQKSHVQWDGENSKIMELHLLPYYLIQIYFEKGLKNFSIFLHLKSLIPCASSNDFESGSVHLEDVSSSFFQPHIFQFEPLYQVFLSDLFTLGCWGLVGGSGRRER